MSNQLILGVTSNINIDQAMNVYRGGRRQILYTDGSIVSPIKNIANGYIFFEQVQGLNTNILYDVKFLSNRVTSRTAQFAMQTLKTHNLKRYFQTFDEACVMSSMQVEQKTTLAWDNAKVAENEQQMAAVLNIVNCTAYPAPYVIFGPREC